MCVIPKISDAVVVDGETFTVVDVSHCERAAYVQDASGKVFPVRFHEISSIAG